MKMFSDLSVEETKSTDPGATNDACPIEKN